MRLPCVPAATSNDGSQIAGKQRQQVFVMLNNKYPSHNIYMADEDSRHAVDPTSNTKLYLLITSSKSNGPTKSS